VLFARVAEQLNFLARNAHSAMVQASTQKLEKATSSHTFASVFFWTERHARFAERNAIMTRRTSRKF
jgi:hypothetical protein